MKEQLAQELALLEGKRSVLRKEMDDLNDTICNVEERYLSAKFPDLKPGVVFTTHRARWGSKHYTFDGFGRNYESGKARPCVHARVWTARIRNDSVEPGVATTKGRAVKIPYEEAISLNVVK